MAEVIDAVPDIEYGSLSINLVEFTTLPPTGIKAPLNPIQWTVTAEDGTGRIFVAERSGGKVWVVDQSGNVEPDLFFDFRASDADFRGGGVGGGLRSIVFHPDFENAGTDGYGKVYTTSSAANKPSAVLTGTDFSAVNPGSFDNVLTEWQVDPTNSNRIDPTSKREVLRYNQPGEGHLIEGMIFNPNAQPGDADYGLLYFVTGDGDSENVDPVRAIQSKNNLLGKAMRIDPLEQADGSPFGTPADNPFADAPEAATDITYKMIFATGFRHPEHLAFDTGGDGKLIVTDIGQNRIEEVNLIEPGGNYGWPFREGSFSTTPNGDTWPSLSFQRLYTLPANDAQYDYIYPVAQYDHTSPTGGIGIPRPGGGKSAVANFGGFVWRDESIPEFVGTYFFGDIPSGRLFYLDADTLVNGQEQTIQEVRVFINGVETSLLELVRDELDYWRVDPRMFIDDDGAVYVTTKANGKIYRMLPYVANAGDQTILGTAGEDTLIGGTGNDSMDGLAGDDSLASAAGNDTGFGRGGNDTLAGGPGNDSMVGDDGNDWVFGNGGNDTVAGGPGNDTLDGGEGNDMLRGNSGDDVFIIHAHPGEIDRVDDNDGIDTVVFSGFDPIETVTNVTSTAGDLVFTFTNGSSALILDQFLGRTVEFIQYNGVLQPLGTSLTGTSSFIDFLGRPLANGTVYDGTNAANNVTGGLLADFLSGGIGNDTLTSRDGDDTVLGGDNNDLLDSGLGNDLVLGGSGNDTILGRGGDDAIYGGAGDDSIRANDGNDTLKGGSRHDTLDGSAGNDLVMGQGGNDDLFGFIGNDTLVGGDGVDEFVGGDGADVFVFAFDSVAPAGSLEIVRDFDKAEGDLIDLSAFLFSSPFSEITALFVAQGPHTLFRLSAIGGVDVQMRDMTVAELSDATIFLL